MLRSNLGILKISLVMFILFSGSVGLFSQSAMAQAPIIGDVTVTIHSLSTSFASGAESSGTDFYAVVSIDGVIMSNEDIGTQDDLEDRNSIQPNWKFTQTVQYQPGDIIPIVIEIWDEDTLDPDDQLDVGFERNDRNADNSVEFIPCKISGDGGDTGNAIPAKCGVIITSFAGGSQNPPVDGNDGAVNMTYSIDVDNSFLRDAEPVEPNGCLIATAAFGSEMAPQVQFLREIRDNTVMSTESGATFMTGFNTIYYSFAPTVAGWEQENPLFKELVRAFITPMISTLSIMALADDGSEVEVLGLGISVIALNLGMYIAAPALVGFKVHKHLKSRK